MKNLFLLFLATSLQAAGLVSVPLSAPPGGTGNLSNVFIYPVDSSLTITTNGPANYGLKVNLAPSNTTYITNITLITNIVRQTNTYITTNINTIVSNYSVSMLKMDNTNLYYTLSEYKGGNREHVNRYGYTNTLTKVAKGQPITVMCLGSGLIDFMQVGIRISMTNAFNAMGGGITYMDQETVKLGGSYCTNDANYFYSQHGIVISNSTLDFVGLTSGNVYEIDYLANTNATAFQVLQSTNGSLYGPVATINGFNATTVGKVFRWTNSTVQYVQPRISGLTNTTTILQVIELNTTVSNGVIWQNYSKQSSNPSDLLSCATNIWVPIIQSWNPSLILINFNDGGEFYITNSLLKTFMPYVRTYLPNAEICYLGCYPAPAMFDAQGNSTLSEAGSNPTLRNDALVRGYSYFDSWNSFALGDSNPTNLMVQRGLMLSTDPIPLVHLTASGFYLWGDMIWNWLDIPGMSFLVSKITSSGGSGGSQTPWTSAIDAAGYNVDFIFNVGVTNLYLKSGDGAAGNSVLSCPNPLEPLGIADAGYGLIAGITNQSGTYSLFPQRTSSPFDLGLITSGYWYRNLYASNFYGSVFASNVIAGGQLSLGTIATNAPLLNASSNYFIGAVGFNGIVHGGTGIFDSGVVSHNSLTVDTGDIIASTGSKFNGNGLTITNINATNISSGTLSDARLSGSALTNNDSRIWTNSSGTLYLTSPYNIAQNGNDIVFGFGTTQLLGIDKFLDVTMSSNAVFGFSKNTAVTVAPSTTATSPTIGTWLFQTNGIFGGSITVTNYYSIPTNYVAANFVPVAGMATFPNSNGAMYKVTQSSTNLISGP